MKKNKLMETTKVANITQENYRIKTIELEAELEAEPGQFLMVWVPGVGERPFSIGLAKPLTLTIANVGPVSNAVCSMNAGDLLSFKGPLGNGFCLDKKSKEVLLVGGGYGVVPLYFLASEAKQVGIKTMVVLGARNEKDIVYEEKFKKLGCSVVVATDDGSKGFRGNAIECTKDQFKKKKFGSVYSCGPEKMMYFLALYCKENSVPCQLSLERYMKCGLGICRSCALNKVFVCRDGPVFSGEMLLNLSDFGKITRDGTGKIKPL